MDDSKPDLSGLRASVNFWLFWADHALRPGKLSTQDTIRAMQDHRTSLEAGRDGLLAVIAKLAPQFPAEAAEIERSVAQMLHAASWIWQLHPAPTPNARDTVRRAVIKKENPKRAREGRKASPQTRGIDAVFNAALPPDWRDLPPWPLSFIIEEKMEKILDDRMKQMPSGRRIKSIKQPAIYDRLKKLKKLTTKV